MAIQFRGGGLGLNGPANKKITFLRLPLREHKKLRKLNYLLTLWPPPGPGPLPSSYCIIRGVESFTISTINFSIHGSNKRYFLTNYLKSLGLNQAYVLLQLRNSYYIELICSFGSTEIYYSYKKKFIHLFFIWITRMIFDWYWKRL